MPLSITRPRYTTPKEAPVSFELYAYCNIHVFKTEPQSCRYRRYLLNRTVQVQ
jgi:hypothetical protein